MFTLDVQTVLAVNAAISIICAFEILYLWLKNRKKYSGLLFWASFFIFQVLALILLSLKGMVSEWISGILASTMIVVGVFLMYVGLNNFFGKTRNYFINYFYIAIFILVHYYFTFITPSLMARNINISIGIMVMFFQSFWLVTYEVSTALRRIANAATFVFLTYVVVSIVRFFIILSAQANNDLFKIGFLDTASILIYALLLILLSYSLSLMINHRLLSEVVSEKEKFSAVFNLSSYAIIISQVDDGLIIDVNDGFFKVTGHEKRAVIGKTAIELDLWKDVDDRASVVRDLKENGAVTNLELYFRKKNGEIITGLFSAELISINEQKYILSILHDITYDRQMQQLFSSALNAMNEGMALHQMIYDNNGEAIDYKILNVNSAYEKILGISRKDVINKKASAVYQVKEAPYLHLYNEVVKTKTSNKFETDFTPLEKTFLISAFPFDSDKFATVFMEITERKTKEENLKKALFESKENISQIEKVNQLMIDRENKMVELKEEIAELKKKLKNSKK